MSVYKGINMLYEMIIRILSGFIFSSKKRKRFRNKYLKKVSVLNSINGVGNKILLIENNTETEVSPDFFKGFLIRIEGNNNVIKVEAPYKFVNSKLNIKGDENSFILKKCNATGVLNAKFMMWAYGNNREIFIDEGFSCGGADFINNISNNKIIVGKDCMFSEEIIVRADDGHVIYEKGSDNIINSSKEVNIGNHVWISRRSYIGKDVKIANGCVVGFGAVVISSQLENNAVIAGVPAKIVKRNIEWERYNHNSIPETRMVVERERERERERE